MIDDTVSGLAVSNGSTSESIAPIAPKAKGRKSGGLTKAAQQKAQQALEVNGFTATIKAAQGTAATVEDFAAQLEQATADYCSDRLAAVPHNIQARVMQEVAANEPENFQSFRDALGKSLESLNFESLG